MTAAPLDALLARISAAEILEDPVAEDGIVHGRASLEAAGTVVAVNVDPELEDVEGEPDIDVLLDGVTRILSIGEARWRAILDEVADEIEEAVDGEEIIEQTDLRDEMEAGSVAVFADAVLVALRAPRQFPDARILVQLDDELEIEDVQVAEGDGVETIVFPTADALYEYLSGPDAD